MTGALFAVVSPAAEAAVDVRHVAGYTMAPDVLTTLVRHESHRCPEAATVSTDDDCKPRKKNHCKGCVRPQGPPGPEGPRGTQGSQGPQGQSGTSISTAFQGNNQFIGYAPGDGSTLVRDPRTTPPWHNLSSVSGYPGNVTGVSLSVMGRTLRVTVVNKSGSIAQTQCTVNPTPGTGQNPAWPGNCAPFTNFTLPMRTMAAR
ncbi:hypothetical protein [Sphaerisporangium sp. NPDC051011]|uniref:hypothetical protein n=1 Tax=Sphaerisporangium sp. NPDC051011 TaxID=3155792 RepID=UPI0033D2669B